MTIYDYASKFIQTGIAIIPVHYKDKRPNFKYLPIGADGNPSWEPYKTQLPDYSDLKRWFENQSNYGVVCGWQNLIVLDFDDMAEYNTWLMWATRAGGVAQRVGNSAFRVSTNRGVHVYVRLPHKEKNRKAGKVDIKGDGYVLGPGSIHPSGVEYQPMRESLNIPQVAALSDILPASLLVSNIPSNTPAPAGVWQIHTVGQAPSNNLIKKIKSSFHIEDIFPQAKQSGQHWYLDQCPLHDDHNPSFWINTEQQICGCFAGCNTKPMDVIDLFARMHGLTNRDAIKMMAEKL